MVGGRAAHLPATGSLRWAALRASRCWQRQPLCWREAAPPRSLHCALARLPAHVLALLEVERQRQEGEDEQDQGYPGEEDMRGVVPVEVSRRGRVHIVMDGGT